MNMKILLVSSMPPWPTNRGGNQRSFHLFNALSKIGDVDLILVYPTSKFTQCELTILKDRFNTKLFLTPPRRASYFPWSMFSLFSNVMADRLTHNLGSHNWAYQTDKNLNQIIKDTVDIEEYELFVGRYLKPICQTGIVDEHPVIIDIDDLDTQKYESRLYNTHSFIKKIIFRYHIFQLRKVIPHRLKQAKHLWVTNKNDQTDVQNLSNGVASVLPNIPFYKGDPINTSAADGHNILLVCSMEMSFNERATEDFISEIWPNIISSVPQATLTLIGSRMSNAQITRWNKVDGVTSMGTVESLTEYYHKSAFTITPIFDGGGSKIKVAESLLYGRTCVITSHAQRGYEEHLLHGESLLVSDDKYEFATNCIKLLNNSEERDALACKGQSVIQNYFSTDMFDKLVESTVKSMFNE